MRPLFLIAIFFLKFSLISGCSVLQKEVVQGNGQVVEKTRSVGSFQRLKSEGPIDILLSIEEGPLKVKGDSNLLPYIRTEVKGKELEIGLKGPVRTESPLLVVVPANNLDHIEKEGAGDVRSDGRLQWGQAKVKMEGSGDLHLHVTAKELRFVSKGAGSAHLEGNAERFRVENDGAGDVNALDLMATRVECYSEGAGDVKVDATVKLIVESDGSGDLIYKKAPPNIDVRTDGSGDVREAR